MVKVFLPIGILNSAALIIAFVTESIVSKLRELFLNDSQSAFDSMNLRESSISLAKRTLMEVIVGE